MDLTGPWRFCPDPFADADPAAFTASDYDDSAWGVSDLPCVFDDLAPSLASYEGVVWLRRKVRIDACWEWPVLRLASVNARAEVFWNGVSIGGGDDPFLPIEIPLLGHLRNGADDVVTLRIDNRRRAGEVPGLQRGWRPYGGVLGGIEIIGRKFVHIESVQFDAGADGTWRCCVRVANRGTFAQEVVARVGLQPESASPPRELRQNASSWRLSEPIVTKTSSNTTLGTNDVAEFEFTGCLADATLWTPDAPYRYSALVTVDWVESWKEARAAERAWHLADQVAVDAGFRTIAVEDGRITLNGKPIFLRGFNRHQDSPDKGMVVDPELAEADLNDMKAAGANCVRLCHYPHDPSTLDLCDRLGLLALVEIPLYWWGDVDEDHAAKLSVAERQLTKLIARDRNHPSVIAWSVSNENNESVAAVRDGNQALVQLAKSLDPTRLSVHVADRWDPACFDADDAICLNRYPTWGSHLTGKPPLTWRDMLAGMRTRYPDKPIVVTEFGYTGLAGIAAGSSGEAAQAEAIGREFDDLAGAPGVGGAIVWCWADHAWPEDGWHGRVTTSPFGVVDRDRVPKEALAAITKRFTDKAQLHMVRHDLDGVPPIDAPPVGYHLRSANPEDIPALNVLLAAAYPDYPWDEAMVQRELFDDTTVKTIYVVEHLETRALAGTASARLLPERYPDAGYLHWVAAHPDHRGKGFGRLCTVAVLNEFVRRGLGHSVLDTDDFRVPAIRIYLALGYVPRYVHASHPERWAALEGVL